MISQDDQIFLVLCGHQHGQSMRVDNNKAGNPVYQVLVDYQGRGQAGVDAGQTPPPIRRKPIGTGDGWFRLMEFDLAGDQPSISVKTYSSHHGVYSSEEQRYAQWYKGYEQPHMSDEAFQKADELTILLEGFRQRFGQPEK